MVITPEVWKENEDRFVPRLLGGLLFEYPEGMPLGTITFDGKTNSIRADGKIMLMALTGFRGYPSLFPGIHTVESFSIDFPGWEKINKISESVLLTMVMHQASIEDGDSDSIQHLDVFSDGLPYGYLTLTDGVVKLVSMPNPERFKREVLARKRPLTRIF